MFPLGAIIGLAGQATSGILSILNNKRMQRQADEEAARQQSYYNAMANENPLARSEVQHMLGQYDRESQRQMENARNLSKITGATPEFASSIQKGVAEGRANMMGNITAGARARADRYKQMGEIARHQKAMEDQERLMARNSTYAALAGNAASAVGAIMDGYSAKNSPNKIAQRKIDEQEGIDAAYKEVQRRNEANRQQNLTAFAAKMNEHPAPAPPLPTRQSLKLNAGLPPIYV